MNNLTVKNDEANEIKLEDTNEMYLQFNEEAGEFLKIDAEGKITFGTKVHENNVDDIARRFIKIVEDYKASLNG